MNTKLTKWPLAPGSKLMAPPNANAERAAALAARQNVFVIIVDCRGGQLCAHKCGALARPYCRRKMQTTSCDESSALRFGPSAGDALAAAAYRPIVIGHLGAERSRRTKVVNEARNVILDNFLLKCYCRRALGTACAEHLSAHSVFSLSRSMFQFLGPVRRSDN